nr:MAG TPA: hypothetical protein [Caudoviricetes sp.]
MKHCRVRTKQRGWFDAGTVHKCREVLVVFSWY